jgi:hypothetical protein
MRQGLDNRLDDEPRALGVGNAKLRMRIEPVGQPARHHRARVHRGLYLTCSRHLFDEDFVQRRMNAARLTRPMFWTTRPCCS